MSDLITMEPSIHPRRHPSIRLWTKPSIGLRRGQGGRGGVYRGVGVRVSVFNEGVKGVRVSRNPVSRHPRGFTRAVFKSPGGGVVIQSETKSYCIKRFLIIYKDLIKEKEERKKV